ncbi:MAG TPA: DUF2071 domain-containing protein [Herpetosiphonaceae bacterium]|nr:DUF2071 domain-containing protein [Herpetosiphonaceae bacterium]
MIERTDHRPFPPPTGPWIMKQIWNDLLFIHWPVAVDALRPFVPATLDIDTFDGQAWIGLTPFWMSGVRPRWLPSLPWLSTFPELNVRTYVTNRSGGERKPGVFFFSLDAANPIAVATARRLFQLPYYRARMAARRLGDGVDYASHRRHPKAPPVSFRARYRPMGDPVHAARGSLPYFLCERYCLYTPQSRDHIYRAEIHHAPWPLQAAEAEIMINTMTAPYGIVLPPAKPLLHFARRLEVMVWPLERVL